MKLYRSRLQPTGARSTGEGASSFPRWRFALEVIWPILAAGGIVVTALFAASSGLPAGVQPTGARATDPRRLPLTARGTESPSCRLSSGNMKASARRTSSTSCRWTALRSQGISWRTAATWV